MNLKGLIVVAALFFIMGCTIGTSDTVRLRGNVNPAQISLDKKTSVTIEASVENIGNTSESITVDVDDNTQGLSIEKPERTTFTLKPGESRVVMFIGVLEEAAPPGDYRIDISAATARGEVIKETVFLDVVAERGFI